MRATTIVWLAARNIGDSKDEIFVTSGPFAKCVMDLAQWISPRSMAKRFDVAICRSEEEAQNALRLRSTSAAAAIVDESIMESLTKMMAEGIEE